MTVGVVLEQRYYRTPDGHIWTPSLGDYSFWKRYLVQFDRVLAIARVKDLPHTQGTWKRANGPGVEFAPVPWYIGPRQYLGRMFAVRRALKHAARSCDAIILRIPSHLANCLEHELSKERRPYAVEAVGDPDNQFAPRATEHWLRPLYRWWFARRMRTQCLRASAVAYVTENALQRHYPPFPEIHSSREARRTLVTIRDGQWPKFVTRYSTVDLPATAFGRSLNRADLVRREFDIITVGSLAQPYKGIDVLLRAIAHNEMCGFPISAIIIGDGRYRERLEVLSKRLALTGRVTFTGELPGAPAVRSFLDRSRLFVLSSRAEGLPRAMIEAMARGLPCIGTEIGGIPELLPRDSLVPPDDFVALAAKLRTVLRDLSTLVQWSARNLKCSMNYRAEHLEPRRAVFYWHVRCHALRAKV